MKACPHCGGEIRPSVIRCVHCGMSLSGDAQPPAVVAARAREVAPVAPVVRVEAPAARPPENRTPAADPWVTPSVRADGHTPLPMPQGPTRSLGSTSVRRVDHILIASGVLAIGAAVLGFSALSLPWMTGRLSSIGERGNEHPVAELTFRASDSFGGMVALAIAVVMTLVGLLWFWYGLDRGARLPSLAHPGIAIVAGLAGGATMAVSKLGWVSWEGAFLTHAREAGLTREAMQALLDDGAKRVVEIEQLSGSHRFGYAAAVAMAAGLVAVWSQRQRAFR